MNEVIDLSRRSLLRSVALAACALPLAGQLAPAAAAAPLVTADDPTAKALKYVDDAKKAADAKPGAHCANCSLYQGAAGSTQGGCAIFPGKEVKAAGWCVSWVLKA